MDEEDEREVRHIEEHDERILVRVLELAMVREEHGMGLVPGIGMVSAARPASLE